MGEKLVVDVEAIEGFRDDDRAGLALVLVLQRLIDKHGRPQQVVDESKHQFNRDEFIARVDRYQALSTDLGGLGGSNIYETVADWVDAERERPVVGAAAVIQRRIDWLYAEFGKEGDPGRRRNLNAGMAELRALLADPTLGAPLVDDAAMDRAAKALRTALGEFTIHAVSETTEGQALIVADIVVRAALGAPESA